MLIVWTSAASRGVACVFSLQRHALVYILDEDEEEASDAEWAIICCSFLVRIKNRVWMWWFLVHPPDLYPLSHQIALYPIFNHLTMVCSQNTTKDKASHGPRVFFEFHCNLLHPLIWAGCSFAPPSIPLQFTMLAINSATSLLHACIASTVCINQVPIKISALLQSWSSLSLNLGFMPHYGEEDCQKYVDAVQIFWQHFLEINLLISFS